ncbi:unnamed protein product [Linum tenue]|uniref:Movement protein n=1 Tax=Linum tenue TaxID=586396 RepID=A0AAV0RRR6_9ROSI|nr:unnamed protein product [Linum tenue]
MSDNPTSSYFDYLNKNDNENYFLDGVIDIKKIREKTNFTISETQNFITKSFLSKLFDRENIIKYGKMIGEVAVPIDQTKGDFLIQVINKEQIRKRLAKLRPEERNKIAYIHISTIQIILKSTMKIGIDAPMELEIRDDRLLNEEESIIAKGTGNLGVGIIKFDINLQQGLSLADGNLDSSIIIKYELKRENFMKENSKPFSVTYQINYALTNSHHSLTFKNKEVITIEDLFKPLIQLEAPLKTVRIEPSRPSITQDQRRLIKTQSERIRHIPVIEQNLEQEEITNNQVNKLSEEITNNQVINKLEKLQHSIANLENKI